MEAVVESKKNGKGKAVVKKAQSIEKSKSTKETGWSIARQMLGAGKPEKEIRAALSAHLFKTVDPKTAMDFYIQRMSYRMLFRAKRAANPAKKEKK